MRVYYPVQRLTVAETNDKRFWKVCVQTTCEQVDPRQIDEMPQLFEHVRRGQLPNGAAYRCVFDLESQHRSPTCYQMRGTGGDYYLVYADGEAKSDSDCELTVCSSRKILGSALIAYGDSGERTYRWSWNA